MRSCRGSTERGPRRGHRRAPPARWPLHRLSLAACLALGLAAPPAGWALPQGGTVTAGSVSLRADGAKGLEIVQTSTQAAVDWRSFSIATGERVRIQQPDVASVLFNRVTGADPSLILGQLQANGRVFLSNPRGVIFGAGSQVDVASLVATTLDVNTTRLADGRWQLSGGTAATGELRAEGEIHAPGGTVALVGPRVSLGGSVLAGRLGLAAVGAVQVDVDGDGLIFFNARSEDLATRLDLLGSASALAGSAELRAVARAGFADTVLNLEGTVRARGLSLRDGQVVIDGGAAGITRVAGTVEARIAGRVAGAADADPSGDRGGAIAVLGDQVQLSGSARLDASGPGGGGAVRVGGDYQGGNAATFTHARTVDVQAGATLSADAERAGDGGRVIVWSDERTSFAGLASARGGAAGGDGGLVEVSSRRNLVFAGHTDRSAPQGRAGLLLLDPDTLTVQTTADGTGNTIAAATVVSQLSTGNVTVSADTTVTVNAAITSAADNASGSLTLSTVGSGAGRSIVINAPINIQGTQGAGKTLTLTAPAITVANVALAATGGIALGDATTWTVADGNSIAVASVLSGTGTVTKAGTGTLTFSAANTYSGNTTVSAGTLAAGGGTVAAPPPAVAGTLASGPFGTGRVTVASGASVDLAGHAVDNAWSLSGTGVGSLGALRSSSGSASSSGAITLSADATLGVDGGATLSLSGDIASGAQALAVQGSGVVTLGGANAYTGGTQVGSGVRLVAAAGSAGAAGALTSSPFGTSAVTVASGGAVDLSGFAVNNAWSLAGTGVGGLGALRSSSGNASSGGAITLSADATLGVDGGATLSLSGDIASGAQALAVQGSGVVTLGGANAYTGGTQVGSGVRLVAAAGSAGAAGALTSSPFGTSAVTVASGGAVDLSGFTVDNAWSLAGTGVGDLGVLRSSSGSASSGGAITLAADATLGVAGGATLSLSGDIAAGAQALALQGSGVVTLGGANAYTGGTQVGSGVRLVAASGSTGAVGALTSSPFGTGAVTVASGGAVDLAGFTVNNAWSLSGTGVGGLGALRSSSGNASSGGAITLSADATLGVAGGATLSLSGDIASGAQALAVQGSGVVTLGGANAYTGGTQVGSGVRLVAAAGSAGAAGALTSSPFGTGAVTVASGGAVDLAGFTVNNAWSLAGTGVGGLGGLRSSSGSASSGGAITLSADATLGVAGGATLSLSGDIASGAQALALQGSGVVTLGGANAYSGGTQVGSGVRLVAAAGSVGAVGALTSSPFGTGAVTVASGGAVDLAGFTVNNAWSLAGTGVGGLGALRSSSGSASSGGALTLSADATLGVAGGATLSLSGDIAAGAQALAVQGSGVVTLGGANAYTGGTQVGSGVRLVAAAGSAGAAGALTSSPFGTGAVTVASGGAVDLAGFTVNNAWSLAGTGVGGLGALRSSSGSASSGGAITLSADATLGVAGGATLSLSGDIAAGAQALALQGSGVVTLGGANAYTGGTQVGSGVRLVAASGSTGAAGALTSSPFGTGAVTVASGGAVDLNGFTVNNAWSLDGDGIGGGGALRSTADSAASDGSVDLAGDASIGVNTGQRLRLGGSVSGAHRLTKTGAGTLVLTGAAAPSGGTTVAGGTLQLGNDGVGDGGASLAGAVTLDAGTLVFAGSANQAFSAAISGAGGVVQRGPASLTLSGANTYSGGTTVSGGPLVAGRDSVGAAGSVASGPFGTGTVVVANGGSVDLAGHSLNNAWQLAGSGVAGEGALRSSGVTAAVLGGAITLAPAGATVAVDAVADLQLAGAVSGSGALTKTGSGTLLLTADDTASGTTTISAGTLQVGNDGSGGSLAGPVVNQGTLRFQRADASTFGGNLSGSGSLVQAGAGLLTLTGQVDPGGGTTVAAGRTLRVGDGNSLGSLAGTVDNQGTLVFERSGTLSFGGVVSGPGGVRQAGSGTLVFTDDQAYTGSTTVSAGTLQLGAGGTRGGVSGDVNVASGAQLVFRRADDLDFTGTVSGAGGVTQAGGGTLGFNGDQTYTGLTTIASGSTLRLGAAGFSGSVQGGIVNDGTLRVQRADTLTLGGAFSGSGQLDLVAGTLVLSGAHTATGPTRVAGGSLLVIDRAVTTDWAGDLSGSGGVEKRGAGTLRVTGAWAPGTGTHIVAGTLQIGNGGTSGSLDGGVQDDAALVFNRSDRLVLSSNVSGTGRLEQAGTGTLVLTGTANHLGGTRVSAGTLQIGNGSNLGLLAGNVVNAGQLVFQRNDAISFNGLVSGSGSLVQAGSSSLTLTAANTYSGGSTVSAGSLVAGRDSSGSAGALASGPFGTGLVSVTGAGAGVDLAGHTVDNAWALAGGQALRSSLGSATSAGALSLVADAGITVAGTQLMLSGAVSGSGLLTVNGPGSLWLLGDNRASGGTTVATGALVLAGGADRAGLGTLRVDRDAMLELRSGASLGVPLSLAGTLINGQGTSILSGRVTLTGDALLMAAADGLSLVGGLAQSGSHTLTKSGTGPLSLGGVNSTSGTLNVLAGRVIATSAQALGDAATLQLAAGSSLRLQADAGVGTLSGQGSVLLDRFTLDVGGNDASSRFDGTVAGSGGLTKLGLGNLTLGHANTYTGATQVQAGTLTLAVAGASGDGSAVTLGADALLVLQADQRWGSLAGAGRVSLGASTLTLGSDDLNTRFDGRLTGTGALVKQGLGTLTLAGASSFSGGSTVEAGGLVAGTDSSGPAGALSAGPFGTGAVQVRAGASVDLAGRAVDNAWSLAGPAALRNGTGSASSAGAITLVADTLIQVSGAQLALSGAIAGPAALTLQGGGSLLLSGANSYLGGTTVGAGSLVLSGGVDRAGQGALRVDTGAALDLRDGTQLGVPVTLAGSLGNSRGSATVTGAVALAGDVTVQVAGNGLTLAGALSQTGDARALTKTGAGTLTLAGANTSTGVISVLAGNLVAAGGQALGDAAPLQLALGSTLQLQASETVGSLAGQGAVALDAFTLSTGANGASTVFAGALSGAGGLVKQGAGTLTLSGSNAYTGATVVQAGTLNLAAAGAAGDRSGFTVAAGATLALQADQALGSLAGAGAVALDRHALSVGVDDTSSRFDGTLSGSGALTKTGSGTLTLAGSDARSGDTLVQQGTLVLASSAAGAAASAYTVASGSTLALQADVDLATLAGAGTVDLAPGALRLGADGRSSHFSGLLQGSGDLVKRGAGTLTLSGRATQTGRTQVLGGTLSVAGDAQLGAAPASLVADQLLLDGGTLQISADATLAATRGLTLQGAGGTLQLPTGVQVMLPAPLADGSSAGALTLTGGGTLELTGVADNRHSGGTTVRNATLGLARDGQLGAPSAALQLDGGTLALRDSLRLDSQRALQLGAGGGTLQVPGGLVLQIGGAINDASGAADGALRLQGGGTLVLDGAAANAYTGATAVLGSTLRFSRDDQLGMAPASARAGQLQLDGGTLDLALAAGETLTLDARRGLALGAAGGTLQVADGATLRLPGAVADAMPGTPGALTKTGAGTLQLAGAAANTHSGGNQVLAGTLELSRDDALGAAAAPLLLDGGRLLASTGFALGTGRVLQLGAAGGQVAVADAQTLTVSGPLSETAGPATLTKTGAGTLAFAGGTDHDRSGPTQVLGGTLAITRDGQLGRAPAVASPGQLLLDGATLRLDANTTLAATRGVALGAGGGTVAVADGVAARVDGVIADAGAAPGLLTKTGPGTLTLAGDNRHGGGTEVLAGTLATAADERLPDAGMLSLAAGSRFVLGGHETVGALADRVVEPPAASPARLVLDRYVLTVRQSIDTRFSGLLDTGSGQLVKEGPGTLAMAGSGSGNGLFQVNSGMLVSASADLLSPDTTVQVADRATLRLESPVTVQSLALAGTLTGAGRMTVSQGTTIDGGTLGTALTTANLTSRHQSTVKAPLTVTGTATVDGGTLTLDAGGLLQASRVQLVRGATLATVAAGQLGTGAALALTGQSLLRLAGAEAAASLSLAEGSQVAGTTGGTPSLTLSGNATLDASSLAVPVQAVQFSSSGDSALSAALRLSQSAVLRDGTLTLGPGGLIDAPQLTLQAGTLRTTDAQALGAGATALRIDAPATLQLGAPATVATLSLAGSVQLAPAPAAEAPADRRAAAASTVLASGASDVMAAQGLDATQSVTLDGGRIVAPLSTGQFSVTGLGSVAAPVQAATLTTVDGTLTLAEGGKLATPRLQLVSGTLATQGAQGGGQLLGAPVLQMGAGTVLALAGDETLGALVDAAGAGASSGARVLLGEHTLRVGSAASDAGAVERFSGVVSGTGSLVKQGAGTWLLASDQAHGATRIESGTLQLGEGGTRGSLGSGDLVNDGLLRVQRSDTLTLSQAISGSGALEQAGSGTLVLASAGNSHSGATRVLAGTLATPGDERLSDASALSVAAGATLRLGGSETVAGLWSDGPVSLGGSLATTQGGQRYGAAVTVATTAPITLSAPGQSIAALDDGNRWGLQPLSVTAGQLSLSAGRRETGVWFDLGLGEVHLGATPAGDGASLIEARRILVGQNAAATGDARLDGLLRVEGGSLTLRAQGLPGYSLLAPLSSGRQAVDPLQGRLMQVADDVIAQGPASRVDTVAGAGLVLQSVAGGSITLGNVANRLAGPVQALSGADWNSAWQPVELTGTREVGQSRITLAGQELVIGGQGLEADLVRLSAGRLATVDGSRIAARLWYNDAAFGVQNSAPGLVLELLPAAFSSAQSFGSSEAPIVANVGGKSLGGRSSGLAAGFVELLPRNAASGTTVVFLAGPKVGETGYSFFNAGAGDQSQLPLFYNGVLPATPQLSGSLSAVASVSENARRERFEETVRTENVAIRLRAGVIAEVGPGKSATGGAEGLRAPQPCRAETGRLDCPPAGATP